jgi:hypothetical protein
VVEDLNRKLRGWANYFRLGPVSKAYRIVDRHTAYRLRWWLCKKHKARRAARSQYPDQYLYEELRLFCLSKLTQRFPWAKA